MTKKQKEQAYRNLAKMKEYDSRLGAMPKEYVFITEMDEFERLWKFDYNNWFELRETILLSCAELVRLKFEIE